jgi:hypothetical protein
MLRSPLSSPLRSPLSSPLAARRGGFIPSLMSDYFVSTSGSDANDGLTPATAKATIGAVKSLFDAGTGNKTVYVAPGTYVGGPDWSSGAYSTRRRCTFFMDGVVVNNGYSSSPSLANNVRAYTGNFTLETIGGVFRDAANDNFNFGGNFPSGEECTVIARNAIAFNPGTSGGAAGDCFSAHGTAIGFAYDCTFSTAAGNKSAIVHVDASQTYHYRCTINCGASSTYNLQIVGTAAGAPSAYFEDCTINATASNAWAFGASPGTTFGASVSFNTCRFVQTTGTFRIDQLNGINAKTDFINCYAENLTTEANNGSVVRGCYGNWRIRLGRGNGSQADVMIENNVFSRPSDSILSWHFFDGGATWNGGAGGVIRNNIMFGSGTAINCVSTAGAATQVNALWAFENNLFWANAANYSSGLTPGGVDVLADPLLVSPSGPDRSGWTVASGSPAIGAGTSGSDIGLIAP